MSDNVLLKKLNNMPGQTFRIPSRGIPYKNGELRDEVIDGEVVVFPMTTLDEIYLKTPDMLFQGTGVEKVIASKVPQVLKPKELLAKDIDYLLTCLRKVSYGDDLLVNYTCDTCENPKQTTYNININSFLQKSKELATRVNNILEIDNFVFKFKFAKYEDIIKINQVNSDDTPESIYENIINSILTNVESVDDVTNQDVIKEFISRCDVQFQHKVLNKINELNNWGMEYNTTIECKFCKQKKTFPVTLNPVNFFTLPSDLKTILE
jgi:hypothetical protein